MGTPTQMYDEEGEQVWERSLDLNGKVINGSNAPCPFLYQGQYYDKEIELAYNRFRYYDPDDGRYISKDPIGLLSGEYGFYNYVDDTNGWIDPLGLVKVYRNLNETDNKDKGLSAKLPHRNMEANGHVRNGSKKTFKGSQFISTTTDINVAMKWKKEGRPLVTFDTDDVVPDVKGAKQVLDVSTLNKAKAHGLRGPSSGYAANSKEVLIEGHVPSDKITVVLK
ncbi:RHS repeat domain-containing protein [Tenacibaculum maritimum]|uniref:RHS repeat domain-containing protein n=2 Tax=Tenacibaculum maritimum TaxID=107401 RepID=UPI001E43F4A5|nr:RHS repeat-associated core domain-containing protein [Tenacibaculum maritimum]MCD9620611.1 hypothetical protein [Tenacibaculum maritimum]MCD9626012.1 hypothetical protein [Tenacibaculum maritimum]MCD9631448.1 hypothetical protein [Tenacibaculum maritimum]MCD9634402.1 hypothetical protein [Tenacibaculum maritimum]